MDNNLYDKSHGHKYLGLTALEQDHHIARMIEARSLTNRTLLRHSIRAYIKIYVHCILYVVSGLIKHYLQLEDLVR